MMTTQQQEYISEWHDSFVDYINKLFSLVETFALLPNASEADKQALDQIKLMLYGRDAKEIEQALAEGKVRNDTLDKIEKLDKDLTDFAVEKMTVAPTVKVFLKSLSYNQIERSKQFAYIKLVELRIPLY